MYAASDANSLVELFAAVMARSTDHNCNNGAFFPRKVRFGALMRIDAAYQSSRPALNVTVILVILTAPLDPISLS